MAWHLATTSQANHSLLLPAPASAARALWNLAALGELGIHLQASLGRLGAGLVVGTATGIATGVLLALSRQARDYATPTMAALAAVPPVAWIPLIVATLGIDEAPKIALVALGTFFIVEHHVAEAVRGTDSQLVELAKVLGKSPNELIPALFLPSALPALFVALRLALALGWTLLLTGEIVASSKGLGWLLWDARNFGRSDEMIAALGVTAALGYTCDYGLRLLERRYTAWRVAFESD